MRCRPAGQNRKAQDSPDRPKTDRFNEANSKFILQPLNPHSRMNQQPTPAILLHFRHY